MPTNRFVLYITFLAALWTGFLSFLQTHLDQAGVAKIKVQSMEKRLRQEKRIAQHLELQLNEYKDAVALAGVKIDDKTPWDSPQRMIASSFSDPGTKKAPLRPNGKKLLENALAAFRLGRYDRSVDLLDRFLQQFPEHPRAAEVGFYLAESYFYLSKLEQSVRSIDLLLTHYPETPYAALALMRLGRILEAKERIEDAADVYLSVMANYPNSVAASMAEKQLRGLNL